MLGLADVPHLADLLGHDWMREIVSAPCRPGEHPLKALWEQDFVGRDEVLAALDRAAGVLDPVLVVRPDGRDTRKRMKEKLRNQFWSAASEMCWGARMVQLGAQVEVEPFEAGPDFHVALGADRFYMEVYRPQHLRKGTGIHDDIRRRLLAWQEKEGPASPALVVKLETSNLERHPKIVHAVARSIIAVARAIHSGSEVPAVVRRDQDGKLDTAYGAAADVSRYGPDGTDLIAEVALLPDFVGLRVSSLELREPRIPKSPYRDLQQLRADALNVLVVDRSDDPQAEWDMTEYVQGPRGAFALHPELSAIVLSRWGAYLQEDGQHRLAEEHRVIGTNNPSTRPLAKVTLEAIGRTGLP